MNINLDIFQRYFQSVLQLQREYEKYYLLSPPLSKYLNERLTLLNNLWIFGKVFFIVIISDFQRCSFSVIRDLTMQKNTTILFATSQCLFDTKRLDAPVTNVRKLLKNLKIYSLCCVFQELRWFNLDEIILGFILYQLLFWVTLVYNACYH